jgi:hypothetical protein
MGLAKLPRPLTGEFQALPSSTLRCRLRVARHGPSTQAFYEIGGFVSIRTGAIQDPANGTPSTSLARAPVRRERARNRARPAPAPPRRLLRSAGRGTSARIVCSFGTLMTRGERPRQAVNGNTPATRARRGASQTLANSNRSAPPWFSRARNLCWGVLQFQMDTSTAVTPQD